MHLSAPPMSGTIRSIPVGPLSKNALAGIAYHSIGFSRPAGKPMNLQIQGRKNGTAVSSGLAIFAASVANAWAD